MRGFGKISGFLHGGSPAAFVLARFLDSCSGKSPRKPGIGKNPGFLHRLGPFGATGIPDSCREVRFSGRKLQESAFLATPSSAGALQVVGTQLCDQAGNPVQLRGVSTHGLAWYPGYVNPAFFTELRRDWNANVVRLALYTAENGGWCEGGGRDELYNLVRDGMAAAVRAGLPVFVSEFGICDASGNGTIDCASADAWVATMNELGISYAYWNLSNKDEASALFKSTCGKTSGFTADDLSEEGTWLWYVLHSEGESGAGAMSAAAGTASATAGSAASANDSSAAAAGGALHGSTGTFDWTATAADRWETGGQTFFRYVITVTNKGDSAVTSWNVRLPLSGTVTIGDSWNATVSIDGAELTLDSVSYNGMLAAQATAQDIGFILSGNALPSFSPITG